MNLTLLLMVALSAPPGDLSHLETHPPLQKRDAKEFGVQVLKVQSIASALALGGSLFSAGTLSYITARRGGQAGAAFVDTFATTAALAIPVSVLATDALSLKPRRSTSWTLMLATASGWLVGAYTGALYLAPFLEPERANDAKIRSVARGAALGAGLGSFLSGVGTSVALAYLQE